MAKNVFLPNPCQKMVVEFDTVAFKPASYLLDLSSASFIVFSLILEWIEERPSQGPQDFNIEARFEGIDMTVSTAGTSIVHSTVRGECKTIYMYMYM